jgi:hypothetical protein
VSELQEMTLLQVRPRQIIISHRREHFKRHGVFEDVRAVLYHSGNTPTVTRLGLVFFGANRKTESAPYQISSLLLRLCAAWRKTFVNRTNNTMPLLKLEPFQSAILNLSCVSSGIKGIMRL